MRQQDRVAFELMAGVIDFTRNYWREARALLKERRAELPQRIARKRREVFEALAKFPRHTCEELSRLEAVPGLKEGSLSALLSQLDKAGLVRVIGGRENQSGVRAGIYEQVPGAVYPENWTQRDPPDPLAPLMKPRPEVYAIAVTSALIRRRFVRIGIPDEFAKLIEAMREGLSDDDRQRIDAALAESDRQRFEESARRAERKAARDRQVDPEGVNPLLFGHDDAPVEEDA